MNANVIKRNNNAPIAQAQPINRFLPALAGRRTCGADGPLGGFPVGLPHRAQNAASFGNSKLQCVQFMFVMKVKTHAVSTIVAEGGDNLYSPAVTGAA